MTVELQRRRPTASLLARLVEVPDLVAAVRALPAADLSAAIREIGLEDAGPLVAAASPEQLLAAFDEDLFRSERPGEREVFEPERFVAWLEVMLEAGEEATAARLAELSEDFLLQGFGALVRVLDHDALRDRVLGADEGDDGAALVDEALESGLVQELDGYLLVSREGRGWDAALAVLLALDRDHHAVVARLLERAARQSSALLDDLAELAGVLSDAASLAEDVAAEREDRRAALGFVEPRDARAFLALARRPVGDGARDAVTSAYFRALEPHAAGARGVGPRAAPRRHAPPRRLASGGRPPTEAPVLAALRRLQAEAPALLQERMEELAYLANGLVAGATGPDGGRLDAAEAAEAALATTALGAELAAGARTVAALRGALAREGADVLFRRASSALAAGGAAQAHVGSLAGLAAARRVSGRAGVRGRRGAEPQEEDRWRG